MNETNAKRLEKANLTPDSDFDRLPPHDELNEAAALGCVLIEPSELDVLLSATRDAEDFFYLLKHRTILDAMRQLRTNNQPLSVLSLTTQLRASGMLDEAGGIAYVAGLPDSTPSASHLGYCLDVLRNKFVARRMIKACIEAVGQAYEHQGQAQELVDSFRQKVVEADSVLQTSESKPARDVLSQCVDRYERMVLGEETGINTGFVAIDANGGLFPGEMVLLCGPTGKGKSTLALNIIHATLKARIPTSIFSFEMSAGAWMDRLLALDLSIDRRAFRSRSRFNDGVLLRIAANTARIAAMPLWVCDDTQSTVDDLRRVIKQLVSRNGLKVVVVDYAQIVPPPKAVDSREQQVAYIGRSLRAIAPIVTGKVLFFPVGPVKPHFLFSSKSFSFPDKPCAQCHRIAYTLEHCI